MSRVFLCIAMQHNWWLVAIAAMVCVPASLATLYLYSKVPWFPAWRRWTWLAMTGLVAGSGVWTTHFVAMLAFKTGLPTGYAPFSTIGSFCIAVLGMTGGFAIGSADGDRGRRPTLAIAGGVIVGLGMTLMHLVGMSGYRIAGLVEWDVYYVIACALLGVGLSGAALLVADMGGGGAVRLAGGAALFALAIVAMHFTGMAALTIVPDPRIVVPSSLISDAVMVTLAVGVTAVILIVSIVGVAFDAASRNGNLRRLREALNVMPEGLAFYDSSDRLLAWNTQYAELCRPCGVTPFTGMPYSDLLDSSIVHGAYTGVVGREAEWLAERKQARGGAAPSLIQQMTEGRWLRITERRTGDGGIVSVSVDITDLKRAEAAMVEAKEHAEEQARRAEAAEGVKRDFLANMSHELRTPLTSIIGFTGLAADQPELSPLTRGYVARVGDASRALLCTVNDILDFSKLEAGQVNFHPQPVAIEDLARTSLDLFIPQAGEKGLYLILDLDEVTRQAVVAVDPDRLRQILLNLGSNAVKFTAQGGVTLRMRYDPAAGHLRTDVADTGAGISPDEQEQLFKRFSQVDGSSSRSHGGTGLGLAICKGLVEAMGGEIGVESQSGEGSRFWFSIPAPVATLPQDAAADTDAPIFNLNGARALVADDHATNRELVRLFLAGVGAEVTQAADGEQAATLACEQPFDVILMDLRMPVLDGPSALRRIRESQGPNAATPVIAFTADADEAMQARLTAMGFDGVVPKPLDPTALIVEIARVTSFATETEELSDVA